MKKLIFPFLFVLMVVSVLGATPITDTHGYVDDTTASETRCFGYEIEPNENVILREIELSPLFSGTYVIITSPGSNPWQYEFPVSGTTITLPFDFPLYEGQTYYLTAGSKGSSYTHSYYSPHDVNYPIAGTNIDFIARAWYDSGCTGTISTDATLVPTDNIYSITTEAFDEVTVSDLTTNVLSYMSYDNDFNDSLNVATYNSVISGPTIQSTYTVLGAGALYCDGDDQVRYDADVYDSYYGAAQPWTMSLWARRTGGTSVYQWFNIEGVAELGGQDDYLEGVLKSSNPLAMTSIQASTILNEWHHLLVTMDADKNVYLYFDGKIAPSRTQSGYALDIVHHNPLDDDRALADWDTPSQFVTTCGYWNLGESGGRRPTGYVDELYVANTYFTPEMVLEFYDRQNTDNQQYPFCTPDWACSEYSDCVIGSDNLRYQRCHAVIDQNSCGEAFDGILGDYDLTGCTFNDGNAGSNSIALSNAARAASKETAIKNPIEQFILNLRAFIFNLLGVTP